MKRFAIGFGIAFLLAGIAGFIPALCPDGKLFGLFAVDTVHNLVHVTTGVLAIAVAMAGDALTRNFFRVFGIVYGLVAVLGIFSIDRPILGMMANNLADVIFHFLAAGIALYAGFARGGGLIPPPRGPDLREA